jgi:phosphopentomutase
MVTGLTLEHHDFRDNFITPLTPAMTWESIFDIALDNGYDYRAFVTKQKLSYLLGSKQDERLKVIEEDSSEIMDDLDTFIEPNLTDMLVFIHFRDPDRIGHQSGWGSLEQRRAIEELDNSLRVLVNDLDNEFRSYNRYYIFTADHGGEDLNHSSGCTACRSIPLIIHSSNDIYPLPHEEYDIYDVACIITNLMLAELPEGMDCKP